MEDVRGLEVNGLLEQLEDLLEQSKSTFLSSKVSVDKEDVINILQEVRLKLPPEIQHSAWIVEERNKILAEAQNEAQLIIEEAQETLQKMIDQHKVTKYAEERGQYIVENARRDAREVHLGAIAYADETIKIVEQRLKSTVDTIHREVGNFEHFVNDLLGTLYNHRQELKGVVTQQLTPPPMVEMEEE